MWRPAVVTGTKSLRYFYGCMSLTCDAYHSHMIARLSVRWRNGGHALNPLIHHPENWIQNFDVVIHYYFFLKIFPLAYSVYSGYSYVSHHYKLEVYKVILIFCNGVSTVKLQFSGLGWSAAKCPLFGVVRYFWTSLCNVQPIVSEKSSLVRPCGLAWPRSWYILPQ